jgi:hypothetical protein
MPQPLDSRVPEASLNDLPALLADPPWEWEPIVLKGLEPPASPTTVVWPDYIRKEFEEGAPGPPSGKNHDWNATAERIRGGKALTELTAKGRALLYTRLLLHGPADLAAEALEDRRYWDGLSPSRSRPSSPATNWPPTRWRCTSPGWAGSVRCAAWCPSWTRRSRS